MRKTIFVIDDNNTNLTVAEDSLSKYYRVIALTSAAKMFSLLEKITPDLILLDVEMPEMDGFEAMQRLKTYENYSQIPVIFLTGLIDAVNEAHGIELGAVDFITKPFSEAVLLNRIKNHLHIDEIIRERTSQLVDRTRQLVQLQNGIVYIMSDLVENRDLNTGGHIDRTSMYVDILINAMYNRGVYADELRNWDFNSVVSSARLHDVGKIVISDAILNKPGVLTEQEFDTMKTHSIEGEKIIDKVIEKTGNAEFLHNAKMFAAYHHERMDGTGYPYGLKGTDIPLQGRIMSVIDVYDALVSKRSYKKALSHEESLKIITDSSGNHFDPMITNVFNEINEEIMAANEVITKIRGYAA